MNTIVNKSALRTLVLAFCVLASSGASAWHGGGWHGGNWHGGGWNNGWNNGWYNTNNFVRDCYYVQRCGRRGCWDQYVCD